MDFKITALVTTYKRPILLKRAVLSVLNQTCQDFKISIFDDASNDDTSAVVEELQQLDKRIEYIRHKQNIGEKANITYMLSNIETPYFSIIHDDDGITKEFYEQALEILEKNEDINVVVFNSLAIDLKGDLLAKANLDGSVNFFIGDEKINAWSNGQIPIAWTGMLFRKEVAELWKEIDVRYDPGPDIRFLIKVFSRFNFCVVSKIGAFVTLQTGTVSDSRKLFGYDLGSIGMYRFVEVIYDDKVSEYTKRWAQEQIKKMWNLKLLPLFTKTILKTFIKHCCDPSIDFERNYKDFMSFVEINNTKINFRMAFNILRNRYVKNLIRFLFQKSYLKRITDRKNEAIVSQSGEYNELFNFIKSKTTL